MNLSKPCVGVYVCRCGTNIAATVDVESVADYASQLDGVALAREYQYMCSDPGQDLIKEGTSVLAQVLPHYGNHVRDICIRFFDRIKPQFVPLSQPIHVVTQA